MVIGTGQYGTENFAEKVSNKEPQTASKTAREMWLWRVPGHQTAANEGLLDCINSPFIGHITKRRLFF